MGLGWARAAAASAALATAMFATSAAPVGAAPVIIDFEDLEGLRGPGAGTGEPVTDQYAALGVTFNGPLALDYAEAFPTPMPDFPRVGTAAIEPCYAQEFCTRPVQIRFDQPQQRVQVWVGYNGPLDAPVDVRLVAFDADGQVVDRTAARLGPSRVPVPINTPLEITAATALIASVEVDVGGIDLGLAVDAIEFERPMPSLQLSAQALDFGDVEVDREVTRTLTVTNVGTGDLSIHSVELSDTQADAFGVRDDDCRQQSLSIGASCNLTVAFRPTEDDRAGAVVVIASNDPVALHHVQLAGLGIDAGQVVIDDPPWDVSWLPWAVAGVLGATAAIGIARALRRRSSRWVHKHVHVQPGTDLPGEVTMADLGEGTTSAVRLESRPDTGIQSIHEVTG